MHIFFNEEFCGFKPEMDEIPWCLRDVKRASHALGIQVPDNPPDVPYDFRFRHPLPDAILETEPENWQWAIEITGKGKYRFKLKRATKITPRDDLIAIKVPDSTPEIIRMYAQSDEQALLAIVRYNRLVDVFLGLTTYSLQNHLRSTVKSGAQLEIDELYIGVDKRGGHHLIPVQAKGGTDTLSVVQAEQDLKWCEERFPHVRPRLISAQFMKDDRVAIFELVVDGEELKVLEERHYLLTSRNDLKVSDITLYLDE